MRTLIAVSVLVGFVPFLGARQEVDRSSALNERLDWIVNDARKTLDFEGLSLIALVGKAELIERGFGSIAGERPSGDTPFAAGPLAELLLAASVLHAAKADSVDLDSELSKLMPERELPWSGISLQSLLAHTSGLAQVPRLLPMDAKSPKAGDEQAGAGADQTPPAEPAWLTWLKQSSPEADANTCFEWSNADLLLLDFWLQEQTESNFAAYAAKHLFPQLGWADKSLIATEQDPICDLTNDRGLGRLEDSNLPASLAGAELMLSAREIAECLRAISAGELLDDQGTQQLFEEVHLEDGSHTGHSYGLRLRQLGEQASFSLSGAVGNHSLCAAHYPGLDLTIVVCAQGSPVSLATLERSLTGVLFDLPQPEVSDLPLSTEDLTRCVGEYKVGCDSLLLSNRDGRLHLAGAEIEELLAYQGGGRFMALDGTDLLLEISYGPDGQAAQFVMYAEGQQTIARRFR